MPKTIDEALSAVEDFNEKIESVLGNERNFSAGHMMTLETNGSCSTITFMGVGLWSSDDDEREFNKEKNEYEPLSDFLLKEARKLLAQFTLVLHQPEKDWIPQPGDYVFYMDHARVQNGRIKSVYDDYAFVVYSCVGQWDDYKTYTGQRTSLDRLHQGWADKDGNPIDIPAT